MHDNYTRFYFNNLDSADFKIVVTNNHDLQMNLSPNFSDKFNSPTYGQISYYEGTTISNQDFVVKCAAINITKQEWRAITEWLSPLSIGPLSFMWNKNHYYMTKVTKAPNGEMWIKSKVDSILEETYNVTFQITFTTVGDWAAYGQPASVKCIGDLNDKDVDRFKICENYKNEYHVPYVNYLESSKIGNYYYNVGWIEVNKDMSCEIYCYYMDENKVSTIDIGDGKISFDGKSTPFSDKYYLYFGSNCYVRFTADFPSTAMPKNKQLLVTNPGAYETYPNIELFDSKATFNYNFKDFLQYETALENHSEWLFYNGSNGYTMNNGQFVQNTGLFNSPSLISESIKLPSGKPEIFKLLLKEAPKTSDFVVYECEFHTTKKPIHARNKGWVVTLFNKWPIQDSNIFNVDSFDTKKYYTTSFDSVVLYSPTIIFDEENGIIKLRWLYGTQYGKLDEILTKDKYIYMSICDVETINFSSKATTLVYDIQTRDVL